MKHEYKSMQQQTVTNGPQLPKEVLGALADAFGKSILTIERWVENENDLLTSEKAKDVFKRKNIVWPIKKSA